MDNSLRTTFIPKQITQVPSPMANPSNPVRLSRSVSLLSVLAVITFFAAAIACGGSWLYKQSLEGRIVQVSQQLVSAEKQFEPGFIEEIRDIDNRLTYAHQVLRNHRSIAPFFDAFQKITTKSIQYDTFRFDYAEGKGVVQVTGRARSYQAIAQQSELFSKERFIQEHVFSNFTLQPSGRVQFDLVITLSPELIMYEGSFRELNPVVTEDRATPGSEDTTNSVGLLRTQEAPTESGEPGASQPNAAVPGITTASASTELLR